MLKRIVKVNDFIAAWGDVVTLRSKEKVDNKKIAFIWALAEYRGESFSDTAFNEWMRFVFNMIHHTVEDFNTLVRFIKRVSAYYATNSENILEWLASEESAKIKDGTDQWEEERCKAIALNRKNACSEIIFKAEAHHLFEGRIRPLLYDASTDRLTTDLIERRWQNFSHRFNNEGALEKKALETFRTLFSFCSIDKLRKRYIFQNTKTVWKDEIFKPGAFIEPLAHLLDGDAPTLLDPESPIGVLCREAVLAKVLNTKADWYIRHPDMSLRPYGNMWNGIRLDQTNVLASVKNLLFNDGFTFKESEWADFYRNYGLVWGVRISFMYQNLEMQLWDDCKLWLGSEYLKDDEGVEIRLYEHDSDEIKRLLDKYMRESNNIEKK